MGLDQQAWEPKEVPRSSGREAGGEEAVIPLQKDDARCRAQMGLKQ